MRTFVTDRWTDKTDRAGYIGLVTNKSSTTGPRYIMSSELSV